MQSLKHVGRIKASGKKVLVAFRTLPGDAYSALVVPTENLPDDMHNAIINLVESASAQESYEFAEALDRTQFPDGSRMLPNLHANGRLIKVSTDQVEMTPVIGSSILLSELNQIIAEQRGIAVDDLHISPRDSESIKRNLESAAEDVKKSNSASTTTSTVSESSEPTAFTDAESEAKFYRSQADKLAKQAAEFRRKAEELVPTKKSK